MCGAVGCLGVARGRRRAGLAGCARGVWQGCGCNAPHTPQQGAVGSTKSGLPCPKNHLRNACAPKDERRQIILRSRCRRAGRTAARVLVHRKDMARNAEFSLLRFYVSKPHLTHVSLAFAGNVHAAVLARR